MIGGPAPRSHRWLVQLKGESLDLRELAEALNVGPLTVRESEGEYLLEIPGIDQLTTGSDVYHAVRQWLPLINGAARLRFDPARPLTVTKVGERQPDGSVAWGVFVTPEPITARGRVFAAGTGGTRLPTPLERALALANDTHVQRVLLLLENEPTFASLYSALDAIEEDVGGERALEAKGWVGRDEIRLLAHTANSFAAIGTAARHAKSWAPPQRPMTLSEGASLIRAIAAEWLAEKAKAAGVP